jgi:hypothetical protein
VGTFPINATLPSLIGIWPDTKAQDFETTTGMYEPAGFGGVGSEMFKD